LHENSAHNAHRTCIVSYLLKGTLCILIALYWIWWIYQNC